MLGILDVLLNTGRNGELCDCNCRGELKPFCNGYNGVSLQNLCLEAWGKTTQHNWHIAFNPNVSSLLDLNPLLCTRTCLAMPVFLVTALFCVAGCNSFVAGVINDVECVLRADMKFCARNQLSVCSPSSLSRQCRW